MLSGAPLKGMQLAEIKSNFEIVSLSAVFCENYFILIFGLIEPFKYKGSMFYRYMWLMKHQTSQTLKKIFRGI